MKDFKENVSKKSKELSVSHININCFKKEETKVIASKSYDTMKKVTFLFSF